MMNDDQREDDQREIIRQESFWFTATTLGFTGFVGGLLRAPSRWEAIVASILIFVLWLFTIYLLVERYRKYRELNKQPVPSWWAALRTAIREMSGTLYCIGVVTFSTIGFFVIIWMRISNRWPV